MAKTLSKKKAAAKKVPDNLPDDFYEVEAVIGHRRYRGRVEYKIRWKGCSDKDDTWEPRENLSDSAMELAIQFTKRQKPKQQREEDAKEVAGSPPGIKSERKATPKKALTKQTLTLFAMVSHMAFSLHLFITLQPDFLSFFTPHMVEPIVFYCNFNPQS